MTLQFLKLQIYHQFISYKADCSHESVNCERCSAPQVASMKPAAVDGNLGTCGFPLMEMTFDRGKISAFCISQHRRIHAQGS
jgi:hypothetical protein